MFTRIWTGSFCPLLLSIGYWGMAHTHTHTEFHSHWECTACKPTEMGPTHINHTYDTITVRTVWQICWTAHRHKHTTHEDFNTQTHLQTRSSKYTQTCPHAHMSTHACANTHRHTHNSLQWVYLEDDVLSFAAVLSAGLLAVGGVKHLVGGDSSIAHPLLTTQHPNDDIRHAVLGLEKEKTFTTNYCVDVDDWQFFGPMVKLTSQCWVNIHL